MKFFKWATAIGTAVAAIGGLGILYFETQKDSNSNSNDDLPQQVIDVGAEKYKEWHVEKDSPIILEAIDVQVFIRFSAHLEKGDSFSLREAGDWNFDGYKPLVDFQKQWQAGEISLDQTFKTIEIDSKKFTVKDSVGNVANRNVENASFTYKIQKTYFLTNTNSLPNSKTIMNFETKVVSRIFSEQDLVNFDLSKMEKFNSLDQIPAQSGKILKFLLKPRIKYQGP